MTTGRINQVANPLFVASWPRRGGQPAAELQRSAVPRRGGDRTTHLPGQTGGLGWSSLPWRRRPFGGGAGDARSLRTPLGREDFLRTYWAAFDRCLSVRLGPGHVLGRTGRPTHWASSSLLVESVR